MLLENPLNILIVDDFHPSLKEGLETAGHIVTYLPEINSSEVKKHLENCQILIVRSKINVDASFLESAPNLLIIGRGGAGMDNIDVELCAQKGIVCLNAPEGNRDAVGEFAVGLLLALSRSITKGNAQVSEGIWNREENRGFELGGKTIGIIGYGNTGMATAAKLSSFNANIIAYDKYRTSYGDRNATACSLNELLANADIISIHVPLTPETGHMVNADFINSVKKPFVLLNTSRGGVADENAILKGLKSGKITHFGTDVLENEKLSTYSEEGRRILETLCDMTNVVITPHVAGWTTESYEKIAKVLLGKINQDIDKRKKKPVEC